MLEQRLVVAFRRAALVLAPLTVGCYDGATGRPGFVGSGTSAADSETSTSGLVEGTTGEGTSLGSAESEGSSTGELLEPTAAQGIEISRVVANQSVNVTLGEEGLPIGPREGVLIHGRRTLIQAHLRPDATFTPGEVIGRLTLHHPHAPKRVLESTVYVTQETTPTQMETALNWILEPSDVAPGVLYDIELYQLSSMPSVEEPPRFPAVGADDLQISGTNQTLEVVFVPYRHVLDGCDRTGPHDAATIAEYRNKAMQYLAVQDVQITVHDVMTFSQPSGDLMTLIDAVTALRAQEAPSPSVFYFGSIYACDQPTSGGKGWMPQDPGSEMEAQYRASVGSYYDYASDYSYMAFVHEVSHNLGRAHVGCGTENDNTIDPAYPHPDGRIGGIGWGIEDNRLRAPETYEFMSYCNTEEVWQSSYGWNLSQNVIESLTRLPQNAAPISTWILRVVEDADGTVHARVLPGFVPSNHGLEVQAVEHGGRRVTLSGREEQLPDSNGRIYSFDLPRSMVPRLDHFEWRRGAGRPDVVVDAIEGLAQAREIEALRAP